MLKKRKEYILLLVSVAVSLAIAEGIGQIFIYWKFGDSPNSLGKNHLMVDNEYITDHPYLPFLMKPRNTPWIQINSCYSRGKEPESPKRRTRIVTYGGSTTFDYPHKWEETWPGYLQAYLGEAEYEVINAAHNCCTTADTLVKLVLVHSELRPDYVLVYHGTNDFDTASKPEFRSDYSHSRKNVGSIPYPFFKKLPRWFDYSSILVLIRGYLIDYRGPVLYPRYTVPSLKYDFEHKDLGFRVFERNLRFINIISEADGARLILGTFQFYKRAMQEKWNVQCADAWEVGIDAQNEIIRSLANEEENILLAEAEKSFEPSYDTMVDHCHLTAEGNQLIARAFYLALIESLATINKDPGQIN